MRRILIMVISVVVLSMSIPGKSSAQSGQNGVLKYPDIVDVKIHARGGNRFDFDVTLSSPYDTPQRYADAFRVMSAEGVVYGERKLWHDHGDEQPFTRDLYGVQIKAGVRTLVVQGKDQKYGYGGKTITVVLPGR